MIKESHHTRFTPSCEECGWKGLSSAKKEYAERDLAGHPHNRHYPAHDSTGGFRGALGGYNVRCVCGASWVDHHGGTPFRCPRDKKKDSNDLDD